MPKKIKLALVAVAIIVLMLCALGAAGWWFFKSRFLDFEGEYVEKTDFQEITVGDYRFLDRNANGRLDVYEDGRAPIAARVDDALAQMTLEEKIHLLKGSGIGSASGVDKSPTAVPGAAGVIVPTPRLGLPTVYLSDGPAGLRIEPTRENESRTYYATAFPVGTLLASTWNTALVEEVGRAVGGEVLEYGLDVILGPGANIHRHPFNGRNFEYYSEDPLLTGYIGAAMVNGIESNGVGSSVKHFVANNQETNRLENDALVSERALREIYLKGFELIVKNAQPWTIMSAYNKVNGTYVSQNRYLLTDILRGEWGFEGVVMTDWFAGNDPIAQIEAGNDLLEPGTLLQWQALLDAARSGELSMDTIDTSVRRILRLVLGSRKMRTLEYGNSPDLEHHARVTRQSASEGMVLLKNSNALPLQPASKVALLGITSYDFIAGGTGSGDVNEAYTVSLEQGLVNAGFGIDALAKSLYLKHRQAHREAFIKPEGINAMFNPYLPPEMAFTRAELEQIVQGVDAAIITIGRNSGEGGDRDEQNDFLLSEGERAMIANAGEVFSAAGKPLVVVLNVGGVIETASWKQWPGAILLAWQGGQEGGNSVADILSGQVNPSGKLPMTFPVAAGDHASDADFPRHAEPMTMTDFFIFMLTGGSDPKPQAEQIATVDYTRYEEGIYVGYRHFDKADLAVSYPFGFGLSYTRFKYSDLAVQENDQLISLQMQVTNAGDVAGKEVLQFYFAKPDSAIDRPVRELKAFAKTSQLEPGASELVTVNVPRDELRYWDEQSHRWVLEEGSYTVEVGASSRDLRLTQQIRL